MGEEPKVSMENRAPSSGTKLALSGFGRVAVTVCLLHLLVGGAVVGGLFLARILATGTAQTIPRVWTEAHANSQIAGVIGLAVMALACAVLPRVKGVELIYENRISLAVSCLAAGSLMHGLCHGLQERLWPDLLRLGSLTAGFVQLVGWGYFVAVFYLIQRRIPGGGQTRFEKVFLIGAVWFGVGLAMESFVRIMWLASAWMVSIHPRIHFGVRYLQLMTGAFLMLVGLAQPGYRGWPEDRRWRPPFLPESMLWAVILAAFFVGVALPLVAEPAPNWIPATLAAAAMLTVWAIVRYFVSLALLGRRAREHGVAVISPWRGLWTGPSVWLIASTLTAAAAIFWAAWQRSPVPDTWLQIEVHAFGLGFVLSQTVLIYRHYGLLWRGARVPNALVALNLGLGLFVVGFPWMLQAPHSIARWLVGTGGLLQTAAVLFLAGSGFRDLFGERRSGY